MDSVFKKMCGLVDLRMYDKIHKILFATGTGATFTNIILSHNEMMGMISVSALASFCYLIYTYMYCKGGNKYTKDITELRKLYWEFIRNYNKLNKIFDLKDPVSVYVMFNYLLYKGYLSKDQKFVYSKEEIKDIPTDIGVNVLCGGGVCRHISSLMTDILNDYGISSINVGCYERDSEVIIEEIGLEDYTREELIKWINNNIDDEDKKKELLERIEICYRSGKYLDIESSYKIKYEDSLNRRRYGNHLITYSLYDGKSYYLDPTQERIYRMKVPGILYDSLDDKILIKKNCFRIMNDKDYKESYKLRKKVFLSNETISLEEEEKIINATKNICLGNEDIFMNFYNDNKNLYDEISNKLIKIRVR